MADALLEFEQYCFKEQLSDCTLLLLEDPQAVTETTRCSTGVKGSEKIRAAFLRIR